MQKGERSATILIVDDDEDIRALVRILVERAGFRVIEAQDGRGGLRLFHEARPDLVLLDVGLPEMDGWSVLERIRDLGDTPVVMLTASAGELEKVRGLRGGADDYITKPFGRQELLARIEALLRRAVTAESPPEVYSDDLTEIDFARRTATARGKALDLTPTEFKLLAAFVRHRGQVLEHEQLLELAWGDPSTTSRDQLKLYVGYLRRKLRDASGEDPFRTVRGVGYQYEPDIPGGD